jgi:molybdate transport system substrate-binding protein
VENFFTATLVTYQPERGINSTRSTGMRSVIRFLAAGIAAFLGLSLGNLAGAAEIKVVSALSLKGTMEDLAPKFERTSGHKLAMSYGALGDAMKRIQGGETADVVILPRQGIDTLVKEGKAAAGNVTVIAHSNIGVAVRRGAAKPDISTPEAFKRTLLAAKSLTYAGTAGGGPSGLHMAKVMERLGIANEIKSKTIFSNTTEFGALMTSGKAEIALFQLQNLVQTPGIDVVGPLPGDLQETTVFAAALMAGAKDAGAAKALITYLRAADSAKVMKAKGLDLP